MDRRGYLAAVGSVSTALAAGCMGENGGNGADDGTAILGGINPMSGPFTPWGQAQDIGIQIAIDEANEEFDDIDFEYINIDSESNPAEANTAFSRLIESDGAIAMTGVVSSDVGIQVSRTAEEMQVPNLLMNAGTHAALTRDDQFNFRVGWPPAPTHVRGDLEFIEEEGYEEVGFIIADYSWGHAVQTSVEEFYPDDINTHFEVAPQGESDFSPYLRNIPEEIEILNCVGHPAGAINIASQQTELDIDIPTLGVDPPQMAILDSFDEETLGRVINRHPINVESGEFETFGEKVAEQEGIPAFAYEGVGYTVGRMFVDAVVNEGADPEAIAEHVRENEHEGLYANPLRFTEWGEMDGLSMLYYEFENEAPSYYPDGDHRMATVFETSQLDPYDPDEFPLD